MRPGPPLLITLAPAVGQCGLQALLDFLEGAVERHDAFLGPQTLRDHREDREHLEVSEMGVPLNHQFQWNFPS